LTVIFARREHARREEDDPGQFSRPRSPVGALLRERPACGCGPADLVAAPSPEGSRPSGLGMPPTPESAWCPTVPSGFWQSSRASSRYPSVVSRSRVRTRPRARRPGAPGGRALEAV